MEGYQMNFDQELGKILTDGENNLRAVKNSTEKFKVTVKIDIELEGADAVVYTTLRDTMKLCQGDIKKLHQMIIRSGIASNLEYLKLANVNRKTNQIADKLDIKIEPT